ncbi:MAG: histidine kinase [Cytophagales bacterium]|nr:histidine kinase [Cytophagales bacterium]
MRKLPILLFLCFCSLVNAAQAPTDSLLQLTAAEYPATKRIQAFNELYQLYALDSPNYAFHLMKEATALIEQENAAAASALVNLGKAYYDRSSLDSAIFYTKSGLGIFRKLKDQFGIAKSLNNLGLYYGDINALEQSQEFYKEALQIAEEQKFNTLVTDLYNRIGFVFIRQERLELGLQYIMKPFEATKGEETTDRVKAIFNVANVLQRMGRLEESLSYLDTMEFVSRKIDFQFGVAKSLGMRGYTLMDMGRFAKAITAVEEAIRLFDQFGIQNELLQAKLAKARILQEQKKYQEMEGVLNEIEKDISTIENFQVLTEIYDARYVCMKNLGKYDLALQALEKRSHARDSLYLTNATAQIEEITTKYEVDRKDQEIQNLTQQGKIQQLEIRQRTILLIGIALLLIALTIAGILWNRQKTINHRQAVSAMEQKLLRLQMNPHFIFNALGSIQQFMHNNDPQKAGLYLAKFSKLMRSTLEYSRKEWITLDEEITLLDAYIEIQRLCTQQSFEAHIIVNEELDQEMIKVPPMFAQPFVENVFEHANLDESGKLEIRFEIAAGKIHLSICDNGKGISHSSEQQHESLATTITQERLALLSKKFSEKFEISIGQWMDRESGTRVDLSLPYH